MSGRRSSRVPWAESVNHAVMLLAIFPTSSIVARWAHTQTPRMPVNPLASVAADSGHVDSLSQVRPLDVAVIIVTYKSAKLTIECLRSLAAERSTPGMHVRAVVVDNASGDLPEIAQAVPSCLLCYEADWEVCHHRRVAEILAQRHGFALCHLSAHDPR